MSNATREIDIAVYINKHVIEALSMKPSPSRDYKLSGLGIVFEVEKKLQACFKNKINEVQLISLIQKEFKGPIHKFDTCEIGFLHFKKIPVFWHVTTINKQSGQPEKYFFLKRCGKHLNYKMTVYRAVDFAKVQ